MTAVPPRVHFRPGEGRFADPIPFYRKGRYHVFYLRAVDRVPWEHIVSTDLVHWTEMPTALLPDGAPDTPDGLHMFTGSVIERRGTFHLFYTGWNPRNPGGREFILRATSGDLIHWRKHPEWILAPDPALYAADHDRDYRDPFVFRNPIDGSYWMLLCARDARSGAPVTGLAVSDDLIRWEHRDPIASGTVGPPECPDLFRSGGRWCLVSSPSAGVTTLRLADAPGGPWSDEEALDTPILYAAKRMFDGRRHVLVGWLRDLSGGRDDGEFEWGGAQCVPREIRIARDGALRCRPVPEAAAAFTQAIVDLARKPPIDRAGWRYVRDALAADGTEQPARLRLEAPTDYFLRCRIRIDHASEATVTLRQQEGGDGYALILRPARQEAEIRGPGFAYPRPCRIDASRSIRIDAFVEGSIVECFVNESYAFSCRAYTYATGGLGIAVEGGVARVMGLVLRTTEP